MRGESVKFKLFGRVVEIRNRKSPLPRPGDDAGWISYLQGQGHRVSSMTALQVSAVFRCVDLLSKTMAALPLHLYENTDRGKAKAKQHPLYERLYAMPNPHTTAYEFWQMFVANLLLTKGAFAKIERDRRGHARALWNIPTGRASDVHVNLENGERYIDVLLGDGTTERLRDGEFLYVPNFRFSDEQSADDPMRIAGDVLGLTRDLNRYAQTTFVQGVHPGGFVETAAGLSEAAYTRLKSEFEANYAGVMNAGKFILLEQGLKANVLERDLEKTQALESRKFAVTEICRLFGVPPHLCMDMEHATFSNIEQQSLEFVRDSINPLSVRIEQAIYRDALTAGERRIYFAKFNTNAFLRGDTAARTQYYAAMRQNGIMTADEIRALEDYNDFEDGLGKIAFINGNMLPLENAKLNKPKSAQGGGQTQ